MGLIILVIVIGFAGVISNQYSSLKRMQAMQKTLDEINQKLQGKN